MRSNYSSSLSSKSTISTMGRFWAVICMLIVMSTVISGRPSASGSGSKHNMIQQRQKRQSDQRLAELETLLALQKYNGHRVRGWQSHNDLSPGFGLIDFDKIGRRKKSTRFSPGGNPGIGMEGENNNNSGMAGLESWNAWVSSVMPKASRTSSVDSQIIDQK